MRNLLLILLACSFASTLPAQNFDIYVSDAGNFQNPPWKILKYDENGENPEIFINQNLAWPQDILFLEGSNTVLISNLSSGQINRHDASTGAFIETFANVVNGPTRMKIGPDGLLYVLQWNNNAPVRRYQLDGTFVDDFTSIGVNQAIGLDWDNVGDLYVSSYNGAFVRRFNTDGNDIGFFIDDSLTGPTNIWFNNLGQMLVNDFDGGNVRLFDSDGNFLNDFILGILMPEGVDFYPNGDIIIGSGGDSTVRLYDNQGQLINSIVPIGSGGLMKPNAVVLREQTGDFTINAGLNDAWFNSTTPGQGFFVTVFPDSGEVFLAWFTYDTERPDADITAILGEPGHRWLTAFGSYTGDTATLDIELTSGGIFNSAQPMPSQVLDGTITITWSSCENAVLTYDVTSPGVQGTIPLTRIALDNVPRCVSLSDQAGSESE
ncbi:MAG TPA: hypothetical protein VJ984_04870 [Xanthomonadales bacterium]|nr:hypothetical protein [Xanthomonadales bacterium]